MHSSSYELNLARVPKELLFLLSLLQAQLGKQAGESFPVDAEELREVDWERFLALVKHHRLFPLLEMKLLSGLSKGVPQTVVKSVAELNKRNILAMLRLSAEMELVSSELLSRGLRPIVLKGPVLATDLYGSLSLRTCGDLDILVPLDELGVAEELLVSMGYVKDDYIKTVLNDWKWRHHHLTYVHPQNKMKIEIHWRLNPGPGKEPSFNELWERRRKSKITTLPVYYLGREDLFLFLVSHGARHGWSRLRWLADVHQMLKQDLKWPVLRQLLKEYGFAEATGQAILLSKQLFGSSVPEEGEQLASRRKARLLAQKAVYYFENMVNLHTDPVPRDVALYHKQYLFSILGLRRKLFFLLSLLHPYPVDAETLPMPKSLHLLYFPLRPILMVWRRVKARKHAMARRELA